MVLLYVQAAVSLIAFMVTVYAALPTKSMNLQDGCRASCVITGVVLGAMSGSILFDIFLPGTDVGYEDNSEWLTLFLVSCVAWQGLAGFKEVGDRSGTN